MGWYKSNYSWAEPFNYGRNEGCEWVTQPCSKATWGRYWCDNKDTTGCNGHRTAGGKCGYSTYNQALPSEYTYFSDPTKGGRSGWNDYCPTIDGFSNRYCHQEQSTETRSNNYGEQYGPNSACWDLSDATLATDGCYLTQCFRDTNDNVILRVNINGDWVNCPAEGGAVTVDIYTITDISIKVICPEVGFFCTPIGSSAVNFTFDPSSNIPIPNAPNASPHIPFLPDIPIPPGFPKLADVLDEWGLTVGSTLFWILLVIGIVLIAVGIFFCCCKK
jgi:hypothetical protein